MKYRTTINPKNFDITRKELSGEIDMHTFDETSLTHPIDTYTFCFVVSPSLVALKGKPQVMGIVPNLPPMPENVAEQIKVHLTTYLYGWLQLKACFWQ